MILSRAFARDARSVRMARHFVADSLHELPPSVSDPAALMVSELATNAIRHARQGFTVRIETTEGRLRAEVTDAGDGHPRPMSPEPLDPTGRGLRIVEALSREWGVTVGDGPGKTVWFRLDLPGSGVTDHGDANSTHDVSASG